MMNVENAQIVVAAARASSAKRPEQFDLTFPIALSFLELVSVRVPVFLPALRGTKLCCRRLSASGAGTTFAPSVSLVTSLSAKLTIALFDQILLDLKGFAAVFANSSFACLFHNCIIAQFVGKSSPTYFAIAQRRIAEAQAQLPLFPPSNNGFHLTAAAVGLWDNEPESGAAAGEPDR